jgi:hypothetical protein
MNDQFPTEPPGGDDHDPVLAGAGARLRRDSRGISPSAVEASVLRRRARRAAVVAVTSLVAVAVLGGLLVRERNDEPASQVANGRPGAPTVGEVDRLLASLDDKPVDPTKVKLVSTVSTFADCGGLIGDRRRVGAQHVGSRGFGGLSDVMPEGRYRFDKVSASTDMAAGMPEATVPATGGDDTTLGTNVQVTGVDELDFVKAEGKLIYDLDGKGNLRITDATSLQVVATLDVTPGSPDDEEDGPYGPGGAQVSQLLVAEGRLAIFGRETKVSKPVPGDPSATRASTSFMTVTFVDATTPTAPKITDRVRVEGSLVSARLVHDQIRLVTTSNMADLGFVMPTTPNSVAKALEQNRRSVAASTAPDWIPDWQRAGGDPTPLVPCERVHVPDTFSGVAMTSMVTFPLGTGRFDPAATSILAPATTLYAGLEKVAISSEVWVDPIDRDRLKFDHWQTAIHEFRFAETAPTYEGSGIVDGSTIGQFAFGEIGDSLAVVTTKGAPWEQNPKVGVDLTVLTPDGKGKLTETSKLADLSNGKGEVTAVRFIEGRVLISTGFFGKELYVIDVSKPEAPRRAGTVTLAGTVGYFHPVGDGQALVVGSRSDTVGTGRDKRDRSWVQVQLVDVSQADTPRVLSTWERPWSADQLASDHHAFTYWPDRKLAMWGVYNTEFDAAEHPNHAVVLGTDGSVAEVAVPVANKPNEVAPPCPVTEVPAEAKDLIGPDGVVLRCGDVGRKEVEWPRYQCYRVDNTTVARFAPGQEKVASFFMCSPAPTPFVQRVLVVAGRPMLLTDQTLEALDPQTFASTAIAYHPTGGRYFF